MRTIFVLVGVACLSSCAFSPPGSCNTSADCTGGSVCAQGACVFTCESDSQCSTWEHCNTDTQICALEPGRCNSAYDCIGGWATCDGTNYCRNDPPGGNDVFLWGTLQEGAGCKDAVAPVEHPELGKVGFGCYEEWSGFSSDGALIYVDTPDLKTATARRFVPDEMSYQNGHWTYPEQPTQNDPAIPTACTSLGMQFVVQEGSGNLLYSCNLRDWLDSAGKVVVSADSLYAWNSRGQFLAQVGGQLVLLDAQGNRTTISGLPSTSVVDARTGVTDFLIALYTNQSPSQKELWEVDSQGQATKVATYAPSPSGFGFSSGGVLDRNGAFYEMGALSGGLTDVVVKYPANGSAASFVYSEANAPPDANDFSAPTFNLYTKIHISHLLRGP